MEIILTLVLFYGGILFVSWVFGEIGKWNEGRLSEIRDRVAVEVLKPKKINMKLIEKYKSKLDEIGYKKVSEIDSWYRAYHKKKQYEELLGKCPKCDKGYLRIVKGKYGKFIGCSSYPICSFTKDIKQSREKYSNDLMKNIIGSLNEAYQ